MRVLLVGDVHGQHELLAELLYQACGDFHISAAIQVGDFGFDKAAMARAHQRRIRYPVPLHVIDGNHEDHHWLSLAIRSGETGRWRDEFNLIYQSRPSVARFGSSMVGFIGGALHVDRPQRHNLLSRFPNYILRQQREQATALFNREMPQLIVTHSCPARIGIGLSGSQNHRQGIDQHILAAGFDPGPQGDCGEVELSELWRDLTYRPSAWGFGHFHCSHEANIEGTRFVCIDAVIEPAAGTLAIWDTEEKKLLLCPSDPSSRF